MPHAFRWEIEKKDSSSSIQPVSKKKALLCSACYARQKRTKQAADKEKCVWDIGNLVYKRSKVHHVSNFEQIPVVFHVCHSRSFRTRTFRPLPNYHYSGCSLVGSIPFGALCVLVGWFLCMPFFFVSLSPVGSLFAGMCVNLFFSLCFRWSKYFAYLCEICDFEHLKSVYYT